MAASIGGAGALLLALLAACGGDDAPAPAPTASAEPAARTAADDAPAETVDPATAGALRGVVRFEGAVPEPAMIRPVGEAFCLQHHPDEGFPDPSVRVSDGGLADVFVWVSDGLEGYAFPDPAGEVVVDQEGCLFTPRVVGVRVRQELVFANSDPVLHNVRTKPDRNREMNIGLKAVGDTYGTDFKRAETMIPVVCDVHTWMKAWIGVVDHPCFAVSDGAGAFRIEGVPPGEVTVTAWHSVFGTRTATVTVPEGGEVEVSALVFSAD